MINKEYKYYVYKTTNTINGKIYIGVHRTHKPDDWYLGSGVLLKKATKKYGRVAFAKEILFEFDVQDDAYKKESEIVNLEFVSRDDNYNVYVGGYGGMTGRTHAQSVKDKISAATKGENNPRYGVKVSDYTKRMISEGNKGKTISEETRKKLSLATSGKNNPMYGYEWSDEQKEKMSKSHSGAKASEETKRKLSLINSGSNNNMWGKRHSKETREKISKALRVNPPNFTYESLEKRRVTLGIRSVSVEGVIYRTTEVAGKALGLSRQCVLHRIVSDNEKFSNWFYV